MHPSEKPKKAKFAYRPSGGQPAISPESRGFQSPFTPRELGCRRVAGTVVTRSWTPDSDRDLGDTIGAIPVLMSVTVQISHPSVAYGSAAKVGSTTSSMQIQNRLLEELPSKAFNSIRNECELVELTTGDVLYEPGERIHDVYFPTQSVVHWLPKRPRMRSWRSRW
jgi:hypothetical protein